MSKPLQTFKDGGTQIALWQSEKGYFTFTVGKSYFDKNTNTWKKSASFFPNEVDKVINVLNSLKQFCRDQGIATEGYASKLEAKAEAVASEPVPAQTSFFGPES
jgi:hypothetical protein